MTERDPVVAVGLLTRRDLRMLGEGFRRAFPLTGAGDFADLLDAIDAADQRCRGEQGRG